MPQATKESFARSLQGLVRKYEADRDTYLSSEYNEAQTRTQFISPLLEALGWDVRNEAGVPYNLCEVLEEKGETHGRPDYTFRINGQTKFFLEAKKPSEQLPNADILQTKRYAWNSRDIFFAGVCDFEQFRFFDASLRPDEKRPLDGEAFHLIYGEYASRLDTLWELSRNRVAAGSLDQFLRKDRKSLLQKIPVDKDFLENLTNWRQELASAIHAQNPQYGAHELNEIVQRLLDRIIFIRIAEDRKVIDQRQLWDIAAIWEDSGGRRNIMDQLVEVFQWFNNRFNGEIFKPHPCEEVKMDSHALPKIIRQLYPPKCNYRFDVIGVELLGSIYERYLGNTLRITPKRVFIEPKPEVRKAGGVYYTPQYIVDYIVKNTVGKLVEGKTPKEVDKIRILDPACGSGSFLIGAFQFLIDWYLNYYREHPQEAKPGTIFAMTRADEDGNLRLSFYAKSLILQHNLYGVDIDQQAVEVTMMSLYLKMLEGELGIQIPKQDKLPELKYNIRCGNSLIGPDIEKDEPLTPEGHQRINPFDWSNPRTGFGDILKDGGFHAVIGNPPWGQKAVSFDAREKEYFRSEYEVGIGTLDIFKLFVERSIDLTTDSGYWGMILPDIILLKDYPETRKLILTKTGIASIAYCGMAFSDVNLDTACLICRHTASPPPDHKIEIIREMGPASAGTPHAYLPQSLFLSLRDFKFNIHLDSAKLQLLEQLGKLPSLDNFFTVHEGIHSGNIRAKLFVDRRVNLSCKKLIFGRDEIARYTIRWAGKWVDYRKQIIRKSQGEYANLGKPEWFEARKILVRRTGDYVMAATDESGFFVSNNLFVLLPKKPMTIHTLHFFTALLNSSLMTWFFRTIQPRAGKLFAELKINQIEQFPIAEPPSQVMQEISRLAVKRIALDGNSLVATELDAEIDCNIYEIYGITKDQRGTIEAGRPQAATSQELQHEEGG